jgi:tetratricopeptide (TPR) repeat protein
LRIVAGDPGEQQALARQVKPPETGVFVDIPQDVGQLQRAAEVMGEQGRHDDAEALVRKSIEIHRTIGYKEDGQQYVGALNTLARTLYAQGRFADAREAFATFDRATQSWSKDRVDRMQSGVARAFTYYYTDDIEKGIELARGVLAFEKRIKGEHHQDTAMARAVLAASQARDLCLSLRRSFVGPRALECLRAGEADRLEPAELLIALGLAWAAGDLALVRSALASLPGDRVAADAALTFGRNLLEQCAFGVVDQQLIVCRV